MTRPGLLALLAVVLGALALGACARPPTPAPAGYPPPPPAEPFTPSATERAVYAAALTHALAEVAGEGERYVLAREVRSWGWGDDGLAPWRTDAAGADEATAAFLAESDRRYDREGDLGPIPGLLPPVDDAPDEGPAGARRLGAAGHVFVSPIGFDAAEAWAVVEVALFRASQGGMGVHVLLRRGEGGWVVEELAPAWISS